MSPVVGLILFIVFFALMVILSGKLNLNIGVLGIIFSFILAGWFGKMSANDIIATFPTGTIANLFCASLFFCYMGQTGVFTKVVQNVMYKTKGKTAIIAPAIFVCSAILAAIGGADPAPLIMSPIAFAFVTFAGMNPLMALCAGYFGSAFAGVVFWGGGGSAFRSLAEQSIGEEASYVFSYQTLLYLFVCYVIIFIIFDVVLKGYKMDPEKVKILCNEKPEPFTAEQRKAVMVLLVVILLVVVPSVFQTLIYKNPVTGWMSANLALKQSCLLGVLAFHFLKLIDVNGAKEVFKNKVPWGSFVAIGGCCMIVQSATSLGITDMLSQVMQNNVPGWAIPAVLVAASALLSFVSNAFAIIPLFAPIAVTLTGVTGLHESTLVAAILCGCIATGLSPVSMGGALWQLGASEEQREQIFKKQWLSAVIVMIIITLTALIGGFKVLDAIFY